MCLYMSTWVKALILGVVTYIKCLFAKGLNSSSIDASALRNLIHLIAWHNITFWSYKVKLRNKKYVSTKQILSLGHCGWKSVIENVLSATISPIFVTKWIIQRLPIVNKNHWFRLENHCSLIFVRFYPHPPVKQSTIFQSAYITSY